MKSILYGFLAAVIGCAIFFACIAGWYELTGQGSGVAKRASSADSGATTVSADVQSPAGAGAGTTGNDAASQGAAGAGIAAQGSAGTPASGAPSGTDTAGTPSGDGSAATGSSATEPAPAPSDSGSAGTVQSTDPATEAAFTEYIATIERELSASLGGTHLSVDRSPRGITITLWEDDLVDRLSKGQADDTTARLWNEKKNTLKQITTTYAGRSAEAGITNAHIIGNLLNERNLNDIILSYEDGTLVHDGLDHD